MFQLSFPLSTYKLSLCREGGNKNKKGTQIYHLSPFLLTKSVEDAPQTIAPTLFERCKIFHF